VTAPPHMVRSAGLLMVGAGVINALVGIAFALGALWFLGPCCCLGVAPIGWGIVEIVVGQRLVAGRPTPAARWVSAIGVVAAIPTMPLGGFVALACEVLATVALRDPDAVAWLAGAADPAVGPVEAEARR
jgi:hypothetical protein